MTSDIKVWPRERIISGSERKFIIYTLKPSVESIRTIRTKIGISESY